jgi:hypothetical protein
MLFLSSRWKNCLTKVGNWLEVFQLPIFTLMQKVTLTMQVHLPMHIGKPQLKITKYTIKCNRLHENYQSIVDQ